MEENKKAKVYKKDGQVICVAFEGVNHVLNDVVPMYSVYKTRGNIPKAKLKEQIHRNLTEMQGYFERRGALLPV